MMFRRNKFNIQEERLDQTGMNVLHATRMSDEEIEAAVSSPFLYSRVRARINEGPKIETGNDWFATLATARRAIPVMALIALAALAAFWAAGPNVPNAPTSGNYLIGAPETGTGGIAPLQACSISNNAECNVSTDEVIATLFNGENPEAKR